MQEFSLVSQINKAVRKLHMVLTLEFHRPAGLWQQQEPCYTSRLQWQSRRQADSGKWTAENRSRLTDPVGALAGMGTVLISPKFRQLGVSRGYKAKDSWKEKC
jgi:hypothetical protein